MHTNHIFNLIKKQKQSVLMVKLLRDGLKCGIATSILFLDSSRSFVGNEMEAVNLIIKKLKQFCKSK